MKAKPKESRKPSGIPKKIQEKPDNSEKGKEDIEERTFSDWLRSDDGIENIKLFVFGNTILVFIALSWPHIKETLDSAYYLYLEYTQNK